jgi:rod shape-determining protein MreC
MHHRNSWFVGIVVVLLLAFIFFMPSLGMRLRGLLGPHPGSLSDTARLTMENTRLAARLATLENVARQLPTSTVGTVPALVYSSYPLNFKNEITVDAGADQGVAVGDAALFEGNLIGTVQEVDRTSAVIQTIFDPNFKLPVRIGDQGVSALLVGGSYPAVTSIPKTAVVVPGDVVLSVASSVPYGTAIGTIGTIGIAPNDFFEEAQVAVPYDIGNVQVVDIVKP